MRKKDEDITELEKADAKRRIEGAGPGVERQNTKSSLISKPPVASLAG